MDRLDQDQSKASPGLILALMITLSTLAGTTVHDLNAREDSLGAQLDLARELNTSAHWRTGRSILEQVEPLLARASASERNRYDLILAHNMALGGSSAAGLALIEQVLRRKLEPASRLDALWKASNLATAERSYTRAFSYIKEGLRLLPDVEDAGARAGLLGMAGRLYAEAGEVAKGAEMARQALDYATRAVPGTSGSSPCVAGQRLAVALGAGDDLDAQLEAASSALEQCLLEQFGHFSAALESLIGELYMKKSEFDASERWLLQGLERSTASGHVTGQMLTRLRLLQLELLRGGPSPSPELIDQLVSHFAARRFWEPKARTHQLVARFAEREGDFSTAIEHLQRESVARERFAALQRSLRRAYLDVQYDMDSRRRQLKLLQERARSNALEETTRRQQTTLQRSAQWGGVVLVTLLAMGLYRAARERRHFRELSFRDGLTELLNHTNFFNAADRALFDCIGQDHPFVLAVGDIDHFKQINDRHGHLEGDAVLQRVASRMRRKFPSPAILGRVGGEEFAMALPAVALSTARQRLNELRASINTARREDQDLQVSMSFGVAEFDGAETIEQLRERADQALYQAKRAGRDRVVTADD